MVRCLSGKGGIHDREPQRALGPILAGGGVKGGHVHGSTDDYAWNITADSVHGHVAQGIVRSSEG